MFWLLVIAAPIVSLSVEMNWHDCSQYRLSARVATHSPLCQCLREIGNLEAGPDQRWEVDPSSLSSVRRSGNAPALIEASLSGQLTPTLEGRYAGTSRAKSWILDLRRRLAAGALALLWLQSVALTSPTAPPHLKRSEGLPRLRRNQGHRANDAGRNCGD